MVCCSTQKTTPRRGKRWRRSTVGVLRTLACRCFQSPHFQLVMVDGATMLHTLEYCTKDIRDCSCSRDPLWPTRRRYILVKLVQSSQRCCLFFPQTYLGTTNGIDANFGGAPCSIKRVHRSPSHTLASTSVIVSISLGSSSPVRAASSAMRRRWAVVAPPAAQFCANALQCSGLLVACGVMLLSVSCCRRASI